jgi:hypothetical protein
MKPVYEKEKTGKTLIIKTVKTNETESNFVHPCIYG